MINAKGLSKHYGEQSNRVTALDSIDLAIDAGERIALVGRSGSGKTTLLNLLAGLDQPSSGTLEVAGDSLQEMSAKERATYRLNKIGVIFQSFQLIPQRTALQNVELPLILGGVSRAERRERALESLRRVGLEKRVKHRPYQLSGGEQQRVAVARAIVNRPPVLLADEPTGNLDSKTADQVMELILEVVAEQETLMILITHDRQLASQCAQRIITLLDGRQLDSDEAATT